MDGIYYRVSRERQARENQFEDLVQIAEKDGSGRGWAHIRGILARCFIAEERTGSKGTMTVYRVVPELAADLARQCLYVEQNRSSRVKAKSRPRFEQMKRDAGARKFDRLLIWKVSWLGRSMREVIGTVHELADYGVTVYPIKSQTGPIDSTAGKQLGTIQAWFAEMENEARAEAVHRARAAGRLVGRPRIVVDGNEVTRLRDRDGRSWREIAKTLGVSSGSVRRVYHALRAKSVHCQNHLNGGGYA